MNIEPLSSSSQNVIFKANCMQLMRLTFSIWPYFLDNLKLETWDYRILKNKHENKEILI